MRGLRMMGTVVVMVQDALRHIEHGRLDMGCNGEQARTDTREDAREQGEGRKEGACRRRRAESQTQTRRARNGDDDDGCSDVLPTRILSAGFH